MIAGLALRIWFEFACLQASRQRIASPFAASYFDRSVNSDSMYATEG
jgi:hypothetical protein